MAQKFDGEIYLGDDAPPSSEEFMKRDGLEGQEEFDLSQIVSTDSEESFIDVRNSHTMYEVV